MRMAPVIPCALDAEHMPPVPFEKDGQPALWCLECDTKLFIGERKASLIKKIIG